MNIFAFSPRQKAITGSTVLFALLSFFVAGGLDANYVVFLKNNIIAKIGELLSFEQIKPSIAGYILLLFVVLYFVVGVICLFAATNKVKLAGQTLKSSKLLPYVICFGVAGLIVFFGIGSLFSIPFGASGYLDNVTFVGQALTISILAYIAIYAIVFAIYLLIASLPSINRETVKAMGGKKEKGDSQVDFESLEEETEKRKKEDDVTASFGEKKDGKAGTISGVAGIGTAVISGGNGEAYDKNKVFPSLVEIDERFVLGDQQLPFLPSGLTLQRLVEDLQNYLSTSCELYYSLDDLAMYVSAILTTPLTILEGVSGTGKSSLPRYFSKFIGETAYFESIQMTYKDRDDLLGYYNDFTGVYHETEFLKRLYESTYRANHLNIMVLDEMNISRIEYYFADFLSVMEFPEPDRKIHLMNVPGDAPAHLGKGDLQITPNTRFVGTANTDDSTFAITDKVIDRAIVLDFDEYQSKIEFSTKAKPIALSYKDLISMAEEARKKEDNRLGKEDRRKFGELLKKTGELIGVKTGNRLLVQAESLVPVYKAMRGNKEGALDYLFAFKVLRKAKGRVDMSYLSGLSDLREYVAKNYGDAMPHTISAIDSELRRAR